MHELSLAGEIKDLIDEKRGGSTVQSTTIEVGALSGVVPDAFNFCIDTVLKEAFGDKININVIYQQGEALCTCGKIYPVDDLFKPCPFCNGYNRKIKKGAEIFLKTIEIDN